MKFDFKDNYDVNKAKAYLDKLIEDGVQAELTKKKESRTIKQNSYLHVCITLYAIEFGYTLNEAKTDLKRLCSFMVYEKNNSRYLKETKKLDTKELTDFIEWIRGYSAKNGLYIPDAEEYKTNKFNIDREIDKHKQYL